MLLSVWDSTEGPVPHPGTDTAFQAAPPFVIFPCCQNLKTLPSGREGGPDLSNRRQFVSVTLSFTSIFLAVFWCLLRSEAKSSLSSPFLSCKLPSTHLPTLDHGREGFSWCAHQNCLPDMNEMHLGVRRFCPHAAPPLILQCRTKQCCTRCSQPLPITDFTCAQQNAPRSSRAEGAI